jgi:hypothetical protein
MNRETERQSQAITKIAFLTGVFEKLVAEAGALQERIEQVLAEMSEERRGADSEHIAATESGKRAA